MTDRKPLPLMPVLACPVCGEKTFTPHSDAASIDVRISYYIPESFQGQKFALVTCCNCHVVYLKFRPHAKDLEIYYGKSYGDYYNVAFCFKFAHKCYDYLYGMRFKKYLKKYTCFDENAISFLDYGCGSASRINNFQIMNPHWQCAACDSYLDRATVNISRKINIFQSDYTKLDSHIAPATYDMITAFHVIEHMDNPIDMLRVFHNILKTKGIVFLEFPIANGWEAGLFSDLCLSYHIPCHFIMPTRQNIMYMADKAGFSVIEYGNEIRSAADLGSDIEWRLRKAFSIPKVIFDVIRIPLAAALLPLELFQAWRGKNLSTQYAVLQKKSVLVRYHA